MVDDDLSDFSLCLQSVSMRVKGEQKKQRALQRLDGGFKIKGDTH